MQIRTWVVSFSLIVINTTCICQVITKSDLLDRSRNYYSKLNIFSVNILEKLKPPVAEDTTVSRFRCFIDNVSDNKLFLPSTKNNGILILGSEEYWVDLDSNIYRYTKTKDRKYTSYKKRYQFYPFVKVLDFFGRLRNINLSLTEIDSAFVLSNDSYLCEFRKSDFSIKRFVKFGYENKYKASWYEETNFSECVDNDSKTKELLTKTIEVVSSNANEKEYWVKKSHAAPITFGRSVFLNGNLSISNKGQFEIENKIIFLDFFYANCIPCYKSHPLVNELYEKRDSNFIVIGVDPDLSDTLHIDQFLERFKIKHPVIIGYDAVALSQLPGVVNGYPTFLLIDTDGKILEYHNGHSEKFLRSIEKKYLSNKKTK